MKILFIDISLKGHREKYINSLVSSNPGCIALLPKKVDTVFCKQHVMKSGFDNKRTLITYLSFISEINKIVKSDAVDIIHFLNGDSFYRYFGVGLKYLSKPVVITYHHMQFGLLRNITLKFLFKKAFCGIVHTNHLENRLKSMGINNVYHIEYPVFSEETSLTNLEAKTNIGLPIDKKCIIILGMTSYYKGTDILIEALKKVEEPFFLYITRAGGKFNKDYVLNNTKEYADSIKCEEKVLTEKEYVNALVAADLLVLPYRYEFDGASGPMIEGIWNRKYIVGAEHGSMGELITRYNLGKTFKTENSDDLARVLNEVLKDKNTWSNEAENFRSELTVEKFIEKNSKIYRATLRKV
ncbi:MAG: glycosyltransferase family 4 protein [Carnobacterium sp.]|nr:glycosyltransferase family 4 protein [Carnobacterium sp.]